ncbi:MAG TPA: class I SAM-dependent methyltransferase [Naasia sp.]|jgi:ubiquinone/menaquinone biosynthesis C-methylase UbiE
MSHASSDHRHFLPALGEHRPVALYDVLARLAGASRMYAAVAGTAAVGPGATVVDVGCGSGALLRRVGRDHPDVHLLGVDPDERMLRTARRKAARSRDRSVREARFERGYAQEVPAGDGTVDRVLSSLMFHHLDAEGRTAMLAEVRRVLRPGGALVLADFDGGDPHRRRSPMHAFSPGDLQDLLTGAGLAVRSERRVRTLFGRVVVLGAEPV